MKNIIYAIGLLLFFAACNSEKFEQKESACSYFNIAFKDYEIPVLVRGNTLSGKIILFVQGGPGGNSLDFAQVDYAEWRGTLEKEYAVAYYDQFGMGNRQGKNNWDDLSRELMLEEIEEVARFLKMQYKCELILMGHSYGGGLVMRYMYYHGKNTFFSKYINLNGPATTDADTIRWTIRREFLVNLGKSELNKNRNTEAWNACFTWLDANKKITTLEQKWAWNDYVNELVEPLYVYKLPGVKDYANVIFTGPYNVPTTLGNLKIADEIQHILLAEENEEKFITKLSQIEGKLLLLTGRLDDICPPEELVYTYNHLLKAEVDTATLPMAAHNSFVENRDLFTQKIMAFIAK